jgi:FtsP/CotA-like multicopper oxidase with cupredoxin domain
MSVPKKALLFLLTLSGLAVPTIAEVHQYNFEVGRHWRSPDGVNRSLILVNGRFPGPTLEGNVGDWFEITVSNRIDDPPEGMQDPSHSP